MVRISFSLPPGAFEGQLDSGTVYIDTVITEQIKSDVSLNALIDKIKEMRREVDIEDEAKIEVQVVTADALAESLEKAKDTIMEKCNAYEVVFPLDDRLSADEYHVGEMELNGERCRIGIVQVDFE
jgi:isoleucyl-tRNA synthetase